MSPDSLRSNREFWKAADEARLDRIHVEHPGGHELSPRGDWGWAEHFIICSPKAAEHLPRPEVGRMVAESSPNNRAKTTHHRPNTHGSGSRHPHVPKVIPPPMP